MGSVGAGTATVAKTPETVANEFFNSEYNRVTSFDKRMFQEHRDLVKQGQADEDISYWAIYKDGTEFNLKADQDPYEKWKEVDLRKVAYLQIASGDDVSDSMGMTYSQVFPNDEENQQLNAYNDEVARLFGTKWGKAHRRSE